MQGRVIFSPVKIKQRKRTRKKNNLQSCHSHGLQNTSYWSNWMSSLPCSHIWHLVSCRKQSVSASAFQFLDKLSKYYWLKWIFWIVNLACLYLLWPNIGPGAHLSQGSSEFSSSSSSFSFWILLPFSSSSSCSSDVLPFEVLVPLCGSYVLD